MEAKDWCRKSSSIALKVNAALAEKKIPKQELAARLGVTPQYVSRIVKGGENLTLETITRLEQALGISFREEQKLSFSRRDCSRVFPSFQTYPQQAANPQIRLRKDLVFEDNIPEEIDPARLKVSYRTSTVLQLPDRLNSGVGPGESGSNRDTSASPRNTAASDPGPDAPCGLMSVSVYVQYQYASRICVDLELRLDFSEEKLASFVKAVPGGNCECADGFLERRLFEACATARGFLAGLVAHTGLKKFPLPDYSEEELMMCNGISEVTA